MAWRRDAASRQRPPGAKPAQPLISGHSATSRSSLWALVRFATATRLAVFSLALASHRYISDYDASVDTLLGPGAAGHSSEKSLDAWLRPFASVYLRWDAFYFLHLAEEGYVYEQEHAFFPLLPLLTRLLATTGKWLYSLFRPLRFVLSERVIMLLAGVTLSNVAFILAAIAFYRLTRTMFGDHRFALVSATLFCLAPSSMFMSSMYAESLFALLSFVGMGFMQRGNHFAAACVWALSTLARSNGIIYVGFFVYELLIRQTHKHGISGFALRLSKCIALAVITISGFTAFETYGYWQFCSNAQNMRPWCTTRLPLLYSFVQTEYWNCGFLRYFETRQIPNFALAAPMILLSLSGILLYAMQDSRRFFTIGLKETHAAHFMRLQLYYSDQALPFIYMWGVMLLYAFTSMHVQVITRFFSSMPPVFWFAAHLCLALDGSQSASTRIWAHIVVGYFVIYGLIGVVLFSNFFPPA
ncbi:GPI mannosyltransferase 2 [Thamnocephalis sphaerospora]|uniref:GPI mannosyltransferase 2 n=1 Tax=Thamnocephalis sphaerospora TaxID=78915 RepID=A0A4P9XM97_9FUNG|nr:GPI mannosyltransferase 2 [Thamnocephalis sphaerospora]|eukprot:RKP07024.1 GPI mannosyltransferase 2 [Thamnocephalis sphaerospora]